MLLARFPFTDLSSDKRRPVLVLAAIDGDEDVIVCAITSRPATGPFDVPVPPSRESGLRVPSWIQFDKIATLSRSVISGRLGRQPPELMLRGRTLLVQLFKIGAP